MPLLGNSYAFSGKESLRMALLQIACLLQKMPATEAGIFYSTAFKPSGMAEVDA
jgi:hypothetical protein